MLPKENLIFSDLLFVIFLSFPRKSSRHTFIGALFLIQFLKASVKGTVTFFMLTLTGLVKQMGNY